MLICCLRNICAAVVLPTIFLRKSFFGIGLTLHQTVTCKNTFLKICTIAKTICEQSSMQHLVKCFHRSLSSRFFLFYVLVFSCKISMQYRKICIKMCGWKSSYCFKLLVTTESLCEKMHLKERMMAFNWQQYSQASVFLLNVIFSLEERQYCLGKLYLTYINVLSLVIFWSVIRYAPKFKLITT